MSWTLTKQKDTGIKKRAFISRFLYRLRIKTDRATVDKQSESTALDSGILRILCSTEEDGVKVGDGRRGLPSENFGG